MLVELVFGLGGKENGRMAERSRSLLVFIPAVRSGYLLLKPQRVDEWRDLKSVTKGDQWPGYT